MPSFRRCKMACKSTFLVNMLEHIRPHIDSIHKSLAWSSAITISILNSYWQMPLVAMITTITSISSLGFQCIRWEKPLEERRVELNTKSHLEAPAKLDGPTSQTTSFIVALACLEHLKVVPPHERLIPSSIKASKVKIEGFLPLTLKEWQGDEWFLH